MKFNENSSVQIEDIEVSGKDLNKIVSYFRTYFPSIIEDFEG